MVRLLPTYFNNAILGKQIAESRVRRRAGILTHGRETPSVQQPSPSHPQRTRFTQAVLFHVHLSGSRRLLREGQGWLLEQSSAGGYTALQPALQSLLSPAYRETGRGPGAGNLSEPRPRPLRITCPAQMGWSPTQRRVRAKESTDTS